MRVRSSTKHIISLAIVFLLLFTIIPFQVAHASTVETRYCTSTSETYKTITVKKLLTTNTASALSAGIALGRRFGVRVWKTDTSETETEITSGTPIATVIHAGTSDDDGEYSATWACPETVLASTDRIVVRVYSSKQTPTSWQLIQTFITGQLGASKLDSATWTVYYWLYLSGTTVSFWYGSSTYPSRITNFVWTPAVTTAWHDVSSWTTSLATRTWSSGTSFNFNLLTRQYLTVASWGINLSTMFWNNVATWVQTLLPPAWTTIATWIISLEVTIIDLISLAISMLALAFSIYPLITGEEKALPFTALVMATFGLALAVLGLWYALPIAALSFILSMAALATRKE